jgi:hypothetical protein
MPIAKSWTVTEKDGIIHVRTKSGHGFTIQAVSSVTPDQIQFEAGYGRQPKPGEEISGKYEHSSRRISIVKGVGDKWTAGHEFMHFLEKLGLISGMDVGVLQNHIKQLYNKGQFKTSNEKDIGGMEDRAKFVEKALYDRGQPGIIRNILQKIADAIDAFVNLFTRTASGVVRGIEAGKTSTEQTGIFSFAQDVAMSVKEASKNVMDNPAFKKWFGGSKVVDENGEPLVVYHGSGSNITSFNKEVLGSNTGAKSAMKGFFFTTEKNVARSYSENGFVGSYVTGAGSLIAEANRVVYKSEQDAEFTAKTISREIVQRIPAVQRGKITSGEAAKKIQARYAKQVEDFGGIESVIAEVDRLALSKTTQEQSELKSLYYKRAISSMAATVNSNVKSILDNGVKAYYLSIKNPYIHDFKGQRYRESSYSEILTKARTTVKGKQRYDGVIFKNTFDAFGGEKNDSGPYDVMVAFEPTQIKSIFNRGTFDPNNPDIMYSTPSDRGKQAVSAHLQQAGMSKAEADKKAAEIDKEYEADFAKVSFDTVKGFWPIVKRLWTDRNRNRGKDTWIDRVISLPSFWKHPRLQKIFEKGLAWVDNKESYFQEVTTVQNGPDQGRVRVQSMADFKKQRPGEFKDWKRYIHNTDIKRQGFSIKFNIDSKQWEIKNPKGTVVFRSIDEQEASSTMYNLEAAEYLNRPGATEQGAMALLDFRMMNNDVYEIYAQPMRDIIAESELNGEPIPTITVEDDDGKSVTINMRFALAELGDLRGTYMPRLRQPGSWKVIAKKDGKQVFRIAGNKVSAHTMAEALIRDGYNIETIDELKTLGEDVYEMAGQTLGIQEILNQALGNVGINAITKLKDLGLRGKMVEKDDGSTVYELKGQLFKKGHADALEALGGVHAYKLSKRSGQGVWTFVDPPEDIEQKIEQALFRTMGIPTTNLKLLFATHLAREAANVVRQHGARARMMKRNTATGEEVWLGYETDPIMAVTASAKIAAGMRAKHEFAIDVLDIMSGTDVKWKEFKDTDEAKEIDNKNKERIRELAEQKDEIRSAYNASIKDEVDELVKLRDATNDDTEKDKINIKLAAMRKDLPKKFFDISEEIFNLKGGLYNSYQDMVNKNKIDAARDKEEFLQATTYFKDMLRNDDQADRAIGTIRGLAVLKYLSFRPAAAAINFTALVTSFPAALSHYGGVKMRRAFDLLPKAMNQYWSYSQGGKVEEWSKKALDHIHKNGWHNPQQNQEAMSYLQGRLGAGWRKFVEYGMLMFTKSEQINRVSSILAAYQGIRENHSGKWDEVAHLSALEKAKNVSDKAHGTYGKANYPHLARGDNAASQTVRAFYVFKTFQHTYILNMLKMGFSKECLYMALSPAILAGAGSSVLMPLIAKTLAAAGLGGDDPEEELYNYVAKNFGDGAENIARFGLAGLVGVSLKGSLATDPFGIPMTIGDVLGAPGSFISDIWEGGKLMSRGDVWKGFEKLTPVNALGNVMKGIRESTEGVTTYDNAPKFYGDKPIVSDTAEAALRMLSFSPARLAGISEKQWKERKIASEYQDKRTNIYARIKRFYLSPPAERDKAKWIDILGDIQEYNAAAKRSLVPGMTQITQKSIKASLRRASKPSKREMLRAEDL